MVRVVLKKGESQTQLFRRFKKAVTHSGIRREVRKKRWFISKNEQRRIAKKKAIRRIKRRQWRNKNNQKRRRR